MTATSKLAAALSMTAEAPKAAAPLTKIAVVQEAAPMYAMATAIKSAGASKPTAALAKIAAAQKAASTYAMAATPTKSAEASETVAALTKTAATKKAAPTYAMAATPTKTAEASKPAASLTKIAAAQKTASTYRMAATPTKSAEASNAAGPITKTVAASKVAATSETAATLSKVAAMDLIDPPEPGLWFCNWKIWLEARRRLDRALAPLELRSREFWLLAIAGPGNVPQHEIADVFGMDPSSLVAVLDRLEGRGLVRRQRNPRDRRIQWVQRTEAGDRLFNQALPRAERAEAQQLAVLPAAQQRQLVTSMRKLIPK